jgi:hypothetical protein
MTDEQSDASLALYVKKRLSADRKRRKRECIAILARAYTDVTTKLNGDVSEAFRLFDEFTRTVAKESVPQKRRGKADPRLDALILAAGDAAPHGQREAAVAAAVGARAAKKVDAARKRYNRLRAERHADETKRAAVTSAVRAKLLLPSPQPLFEGAVPAPPQAPPDGDKYS